MPPQWFGWCYAPDWMEEADVEGFGTGRYYDAGVQVGDLGLIRVHSAHVSLIKSLPDELHVTWNLIALNDDGQPAFAVNQDGFHRKLHHFYDITPDGSSVKFRSDNFGAINAEYRQAGWTVMAGYFADANAELRRYSDDLAQSFAVHLDEAWRAGSTGEEQVDDFAH